MPTAHLLLAHGSRDPEWRTAIEAVAARMQQLYPGARLCCAYLEWAQPDLPTALDTLTAESEPGLAQTILIWPMFLGLGRRARADLPRLIADAQVSLRAHHPHVTLTLQPAIAEHASVLDAMARVVLHKSSKF
jgi:sirohydrochlorin cobaltochelatase